MRTMATIVSASAVVLMLAACGSDDSAESASTSKPERAPTVGAEIASDFNDSMDRAKNVENQVLQQNDKIDAALKEAEDDT